MLLHLVGLLFNVNYDARNHELKITVSPLLGNTWGRLDPLGKMGVAYAEKIWGKGGDVMTAGLRTSQKLRRRSVITIILYCGVLSHERNEDLLLKVKEHEISKRKANWVGHILCRNCLLQRFIKGKIKGGIEVTGRRGRRRRKLLDDLQERRGYSHLKEEALDRTMWRARFGRGFGPVVRQTTQ